MEGYQYEASARIPLSIVMAIVLSAIVILLSPTQQNTQAQIQMQGMEEIVSESHTTIRFPIVHRADFNDPASGIVNLDLFHSSLRFQETSPLGVQPILKVAFPTGAFWTNLVVESAPDGISYPIVTYPLAYKWADSVLQVAYPPMRRLVDSISITDIFNPDVTFGSVEPMEARNIVHFDPLSVTIRFMSSRFDMENDYDSNSKTFDTHWESYIVQGSPYVTVKYSNTTPVLTALYTFQTVLCSSLSSATFNDGDNTFQAFDKTNISWTDCAVPSTDTTKQVTTPNGVQFLIQTREGLSWILFASEPIALTYDNQRKTSITVAEKWTGVLRLAFLPPATDEVTSSGVKRLVYHAGVYPVGSRVSWDAQQDIGTVHFEFTTRVMTGQQKENSDMHRLLMLGLPHHASLLPSASILNSPDFDLKYKCIKGTMVPVIGSKWSYDENLTAIGFDYNGDSTKDVDPQLKKIILESVKKDLSIVLPIPSENIYGYGKQLARLANLAHIAHVMTQNTQETKLQGALESQPTTILADATDKLYSWVTLLLDNKVTDQLLYDAEFGGIVSKNGLMDSNDDFGNGRYNDHHFHYGYILYACAVMGSLNTTFISEYGAIVDNILYDVAHSSDTSLFPLARHKSWYDGHSFASGLFKFADGKSQESSSEAVNCYYGAYLWSTVRHGNNESRMSIDFARLLLATEMRGAQTYWHMTPKEQAMEGKVYSDMFAQNYMVGNLGMLDAVSSTWFGRDPLYVHMINFMPVTAMTYELFDRTYVKAEYDAIISRIHEVPTAWKGYTLCNQAIVEPLAAWKEAQTLFSGELDAALSKSQVLYWISRHKDFTYMASDDDDNHGDADASSAAYCENNDGCVSLGLSGLCCPTAGGSSLGCCNSGGGKQSSNSTSCDANSECATLGLIGTCCPTSEGTMLGCCN